MNRKMFVVFLFSFLYSPLFAKNTDLSSLKDKIFKEYSDDIGANKPSSGKIGALVTESPKTRFVDTAPRTLSVEDKRHITVHMKLANRHFSKKNYDKAIEEVNTVFQRDSSHSGGHFMLAVIAGRKKDYKSAWYHIKCAKEKDSENKKIDDFISKLKTVSSEPQNQEWIPGIYNGIEQDASERTFDLLEKILSNESSQNIINISVKDYKNWENGSSGGASVEISIKGSSDLDSNISSLIKNSLSSSGMYSCTRMNNEMFLGLGYNELKPSKPNAKPIKDINDYVTSLLEDFPDIAISNIDEGEPQSGTQEIIYNISVREFSTLNKFLRQLSPYALSYVLQNMDLAFIPGSESTIWKTKIKVVYKL